MMQEHEFPILEFDDSAVGVINPPAKRIFDTDKLVITFFPEVIAKLLSEGKIAEEKRIPGENVVILYRFVGTDVLILLGAIGCPACAGNLDMLHGLGIDRVMFCGGGGVLDKNIPVGTLLLVDGAIRDEGFSYHYLPPARVVSANEAVNGRIARYLDAHNVPYLRGLVWTTDAIYRETRDRVARRREEGAKIVEMEQAGCLAVAKCRDFSYGALIYGGDDVSQEVWDSRSWDSREGIRYNLVMLCRELVSEL